MTDTLSPDRRQDAKIAEALGIEVTWLATALMPNVAHYVDRDISHGYIELPRYSTDPVAFDSLMQEIGRRGLGPDFLIELAIAALDERAVVANITLGHVWQMWSAPLSTKAAAALAVLMEGTNG